MDWIGERLSAKRVSHCEQKEPEKLRKVAIWKAGRVLTWATTWTALRVALWIETIESGFEFDDHTQLKCHWTTNLVHCSQSSDSHVLRKTYAVIKVQILGASFMRINPFKVFAPNSFGQMERTREWDSAEQETTDHNSIVRILCYQIS
ncbi:hypothetical protein L596_009474 [Steinernema carpocapsae]|uniref:Uncharacterized protein n=1 Tax=Steinernema carpocapsae TaxID=34508 RepID=A0A4V6A6N7_STECR|nr:hypothetical protein L596_009474 [Steinernema carpocapsae]